MKRRHWDYLTKDLLGHLYGDLGTWNAVCKHLGIDCRTLISHRRRLGIAVNTFDRSDWSWITAKHLVELHHKHKNWAIVSEHLGISPNVLLCVRKGLGIHLTGKKPAREYCRKRAGRLDSKVDEIRRLAKLGWSCSMIADAVGEPSAEQVRRRMIREKIDRRPQGAMQGKMNHCWRGGRTRDSDGYIQVPAPDGHPHTKSNGYIYEHRLVMEQHLGRILNPEEVVHHIDANKENNAVQNLQLFQDNASHLAYEWSDPDWAEHQSAIRKKVVAEEESLVA